MVGDGWREEERRKEGGRREEESREEGRLRKVDGS